LRDRWDFRRALGVLLLFTMSVMAFGFLPSPAVATLDHPGNLEGPSPTGNAFFGASVATNAYFIAIGAPGEPSGGQAHAGLVSVYSPTTGNYIRTLSDPDPQAGELFGAQVSLNGNLVLVGAPLQNVGGASKSGQAYLFNVATGELIYTLNTDPKSGAYFGGSVAADSGYLVVGAGFENDGGVPSAGYAYLFNTKTGALLNTLESPNPQPNGNFGLSVAVQGAEVIVGAPGEKAGAGLAYVYSAVSGKLSHTLTNPNPPTGGFGWSVALDSKFIAVGDSGQCQGYAYIFSAMTASPVSTLSSSGLNCLQALTPQEFAFSGNYVWVGTAPVAYLFNALTGELSNTIIIPGGNSCGSISYSAGWLACGYAGGNDPQGIVYFFSESADPTSTTTTTASTSTSSVTSYQTESVPEFPIAAVGFPMMLAVGFLLLVLMRRKLVRPGVI